MLWYLIFLVFVAILFHASRSKGQWPEGPRGIPIIGVLPEKKLKLYLQLTSLVPRYGDFFSFNMGWSKAIILSSPTAIDDLINKRGQKYSSRPSSSAQAKIVGQGRLASMEYGDEFRKHRKLIHSLLGMQNAKTFLPYQEYESRQTLKNILEKPDAFFAELARYSASVTFSLLLGARFASNDVKTPEAMRVVAQDMFNKLRPGYWLADWIPMLNYLPDSLAPWRAQAQRTLESIIEFWGVFFDAITDRIDKGDAPDCFLKRFLESPDISNYSNIDRHVILSELLAAGSETTATALQWFIKAAVLYPKFVKSAQEELDRVVGPDRLPNWEDRPKLPYLAVIIEEIHRWSSVVPLGIFHATSETDTYRDKTIPARTTVIYNTAAVHHSDEYYRDHERFIPERFLSEKDPRSMPGSAHAPVHYGFGIGRRECPGKHVADASLFIVISRLLWAFNIDLGSNPQPSDEVVGGYPVIKPVKFACNIAPRSEKVAEKIIAEAAVQDPALRVEDASQYEDELLRVLAKQRTKR